MWAEGVALHLNMKLSVLYFQFNEMSYLSAVVDEGQKAAYRCCALLQCPFRYPRK